MMRARLPIIVAVLAIAAPAGGCGSEPRPEPGPDPPAFTRLEVTPATTTLFTVPPGNSVTLSAVPRDQYGETLTGLGSPGFASLDEAVATVADDGTVTAVSAGSTQITASLTAGTISETGTAGRCRWT